MTKLRISQIPRKELPAWAMLVQATATLCLREPDERVVRECGLLGDALAGPLAGHGLPALLQCARQETAATLRQEYYDLFWVPTAAKYLRPYESAQRNGTLQWGASHGVAEFYAASGFKLTKLDCPDYLGASSRADYLGFELAFVATLINSVSAPTCPTRDRTALWDTTILFCHRHLSPWLDDFGRRLTATAESSLYRGCGTLILFLAENLLTASTIPAQNTARTPAI